MAASYGTTMFKSGDYLLPFSFSQVDTLAGGVFVRFRSPIEGFIEELDVVVDVAVTTGGVVKLQLGGVDVAGAAVTVANGAAQGVGYNAVTALAAATAKVAKNQAIQINVDVAFATAGAISGYVRVSGGAKGNPQAAA